MGNWNRSEILALIGLLVAILAIIIGATIPEVRCFVGLSSESCPSKSKLNSSQESLISSETGLVYDRLEELLNKGLWLDADRETYRKISQATEIIFGKRVDMLKIEDMGSFPCEDLDIINRLWLDYSQGRFGFSIQKDIRQNLKDSYKKLGRFYNDDLISQEFGTLVGWYRDGLGWLQEGYREFDSDAPRGHFPRNIYGELKGPIIRDLIFYCQL